ncbi:MAG: four helix bundle protein [Candidatus Omnitrophica bacterium]|nr:four helix bundle protein [Candidatus Omnitrophota bacterium]
MLEIKNPKQYDLEERTFRFAQRIMKYVKNLPRTIPNFEISSQLVRSGSSVGANYIEANESLGKKDFMMRIKISRKEAKESRYWLKLSEFREDQSEEKDFLIQESTELMNIFGAILKNSQTP